MDINHLGEVIFEFGRAGNAMRVTAVHVQTGVEAVIQGPAAYSREILKKTAVKKLVYILSKQETDV